MVAVSLWFSKVSAFQNKRKIVRKVEVILLLLNQPRMKSIHFMKHGYAMQRWRAVVAYRQITWALITFCDTLREENIEIGNPLVSARWARRKGQYFRGKEFVILTAVNGVPMSPNYQMSARNVARKCQKTKKKLSPSRPLKIYIFVSLNEEWGNFWGYMHGG